MEGTGKLEVVGAGRKRVDVEPAGIEVDGNTTLGNVEVEDDEEEGEDEEEEVAEVEGVVGVRVGVEEGVVEVNRVDVLVGVVAVAVGVAEVEDGVGVDVLDDEELLEGVGSDSDIVEL